MFIPGEKIIHAFYIPFVTTDVDKVVVSYKQNDNIILAREADNISTDGAYCKVIVNLDQNESLLFRDDTFFLAQVNVILKDGTRCTSREVKGTNGTQHIRKVVT